MELLFVSRKPPENVSMIQQLTILQIEWYNGRHVDVGRKAVRGQAIGRNIKFGARHSATVHAAPLLKV